MNKQIKSNKKRNIVKNSNKNKSVKKSENKNNILKIDYGSTVIVRHFM